MKILKNMNKIIPKLKVFISASNFNNSKRYIKIFDAKYFSTKDLLFGEGKYAFDKIKEKADIIKDITQ